MNKKEYTLGSGKLRQRVRRLGTSPLVMAMVQSGCPAGEVRKAQPLQGEEEVKFCVSGKSRKQRTEASQNDVCHAENYVSKY